jgi:hypothetical protein
VPVQLHLRRAILAAIRARWLRRLPIDQTLIVPTEIASGCLARQVLQPGEA